MTVIQKAESKSDGLLISACNLVHALSAPGYINYSCLGEHEHD